MTTEKTPKAKEASVALQDGCLVITLPVSDTPTTNDKGNFILARENFNFIWKDSKGKMHKAGLSCIPWASGKTLNII